MDIFHCRVAAELLQSCCRVHCRVHCRVGAAEFSIHCRVAAEFSLQSFVDRRVAAEFLGVQSCCRVAAECRVLQSCCRVGAECRVLQSCCRVAAELWQSSAELGNGLMRQAMLFEEHLQLIYLLTFKMKRDHRLNQPASRRIQYKVKKDSHLKVKALCPQRFDSVFFLLWLTLSRRCLSHAVLATQLGLATNKKVLADYKYFQRNEDASLQQIYKRESRLTSSPSPSRLTHRDDA
jgi:hypothetical protein